MAISAADPSRDAAQYEDMKTTTFLISHQNIFPYPSLGCLILSFHESRICIAWVSFPHVSTASVLFLDHSCLASHLSLSLPSLRPSTVPRNPFNRRRRQKRRSALKNGRPPSPTMAMTTFPRAKLLSGRLYCGRRYNGFRNSHGSRVLFAYSDSKQLAETRDENPRCSVYPNRTSVWNFVKRGISVSSKS